MPIERDYFIDPRSEEWWLVQMSVEDALATKRIELGQALGWSEREWFSEPAKLEELYVWLATNQPQLLIALEEAIDLDRRLRWIEDLLTARQETAREQPKESTSGPAPTVEETTPAGPTASTSAPTAEPKKSIFAKKSTEPEPTGSAPAAPQAPVQAEAEPAPEAHITAAVEAEVDDLRAAADDPAIEIDEKEVEQLLADPEAQAEFARYLEELEKEVEEEVEQMTQETGA